jgi:hypothetical protein
MAKGTTAGRVLSMQKHGAQWLAVVQSFGTSRPEHPVLSELVPVETLKGVQRRKVSRWLAFIGAEPLA